MNQSTTYPKIYHLGHRQLARLFDGNVTVQEKVDGSQLTFWIDPNDNRLRVRSRGAELDTSSPMKMFSLAVEALVVVAGELRPDIVYRGEAICKRRHNCLTYERVPSGGIVLFDMQKMDGQEDYIDDTEVREEALRLGLEPVPRIFKGGGSTITRETLDEWMTIDSVLGGCKVEGVVIKNYDRFSADAKALLGKYVRAGFKEAMGCRARKNKVDTIEELSMRYRVAPRWQKALQHLREAGELEDSPRDIPKLFKEVHRDLEEEEKENILDVLWRSYGKRIKGGATRGLAEWYKERLADGQFGKGEEDGE